MQTGVVFPQTEIGSDPAVIRAYVAAAEELGYRHLLAYDHVVGADPAAHPGWDGIYDVDTQFHEPFVLFGYLAAISHLELVTNIIILPQRQTALVAKQAAQVDILTGGKLRVGVGLGWNHVEYEALGKEFSNRGKRMSEQVKLLRRLWTERSVTFDGEFEKVTGAGLAPMPVQRPIPIWFGASSPAGFRRAGRIADGWFPMGAPGPKVEENIEIVREAAAGRPMGMEGRVNLSAGIDRAAEQAQQWRKLGATHIGVNTMGMGAVGVDGHIAALAEFAHAIGLPPTLVS